MSTNWPRPWTKRTLRCLESMPTPPVSWATTLSLKRRSWSRSMVGSPKMMPSSAASRASFSTLAACSSALEGMQPR